MAPRRGVGWTRNRLEGVASVSPELGKSKDNATRKARHPGSRRLHGYSFSTGKVIDAPFQPITVTIAESDKTNSM
jgi:hypothetical protein